MGTDSSGNYTKRFNLEHISFLLSYCLIAVLVVSFFSVGMQVNHMDFMNSDTLYMPTIYKDLFEDGNTLKGWNFNAAPNFFPEMFLYLIVRFVSTDFLLANLLYGIVQVLIVVRLANLIFKRLLPENHIRISTIANFLFSICFFIVHYAHVLDVPFYLTTTAYHTGAFIMQLLSIYLLLGIVDGKKRSNSYALILVGILAVLSDKLFIFYFSIPLLFLGIYYFISGKRSFAIRSAILSILPAALGVVIFNLLKQSYYIRFTKPYSDSSFEKMIHSSIVMKNQFVDYIIALDLRSLFVVLAGLGFFLLVFIVVKEIKKSFLSEKSRAYFIFLFISFFVIMAVPVAAGNYIGYDSLRYTIPVLYLLLLSLPLMIVTLKKERNVKREITLPAIGVLLIVFAFQNIDSKGLNAFLNYYPENVQRVDEIARKHGLRKGVGQYWDSHYITMLSREDVRIYPVFPELTPYFHSVNTSLYFSEDAVFEFVILDRFMDHERESYDKILKNKGELLENGPTKVVRLPKFRYKPENGQPYFVTP